MPGKFEMSALLDYVENTVIIYRDMNNLDSLYGINIPDFLYTDALVISSRQVVLSNRIPAYGIILVYGIPCVWAKQDDELSVRPIKNEEVKNFWLTVFYYLGDRDGNYK